MTVCSPSLLCTRLDKIRVTVPPLICTLGVLLKLTLTSPVTICGLASTTKVTVADCSSSPVPLVIYAGNNRYDYRNISTHISLVVIMTTYKEHSISANQQYLHM